MPELILFTLVMVLMFWAFNTLIFKGLFSSYVLNLLNKLFSFQKNSGAKFLSPLSTWKVINPGNKGLLIDGYKDRLSEESSYTHLALISPTGAGKTSRYIIPNLFTLNNCSMVVTDPSGEIYKKTSGELKRRGFEIQVIDPSHPEATLRYNPLAKASSFTDIKEVAHILIKSANPSYQGGGGDAFWYQGAETLLDVLINALRGTGEERYINLGNLLYLLQHFGEDGRRLDDFIRTNASTSAYNQYVGLISGNPKTLQSFLSVALNSLSMISNPDIADFMSEDEVDFQQLRKKKTVVYLIIPSQKIEYYSFIINLFYTQFFNACMEKMPGEKDLPIYCLMDEFGHSAVPSFSTIITTIRKYKVSISIVLQSIGQLRTNYGHNAAQTILEGGISSKVFYSGLDIQTAKMVEVMLGKARYEKVTLSGSSGSREENLMNADRVRTMKDEQALFFYANKEPIMMSTKAYFKQGKLAMMSKRLPYQFPNRKESKALEYVPFE